MYTYRYRRKCTALKHGWEGSFHAGSDRSWPSGPAPTGQISLDRSWLGITNVLMHKGGLLLTPCTRVGPPRRVLRAAVRQIGSDKLSWMAEQSRWAPAHRCSEWGLRDAGPAAGHFAKLCLPEYLFGLIHAIHTHTWYIQIHTRYMQKKQIHTIYIHDTYRYMHF